MYGTAPRRIAGAVLAKYGLGVEQRLRERIERKGRQIRCQMILVGSQKSRAPTKPYRKIIRSR